MLEAVVAGVRPCGAQATAEPPAADEVLLRWAGEPTARAVDALFTASRLAATVRIVAPPGRASPGDMMLSPLAIFEMHDERAARAYAAQKAALLRAAQPPSRWSPDDGPGTPPCPTDGVLDDAIDAEGFAGELQPDDEALNEKVLFHGIPAGAAHGQPPAIRTASSRLPPRCRHAAATPHPPTINLRPRKLHQP
jgi:hypothetical protein